LVGRPDDRAGAFAIEEAEILVDEGARLLDQAERPDHLARKALAADLEMFERALRLRAPVAVGGNLDGAHAVGFGPGACGHHDPPARAATYGLPSRAVHSRL